jgi:hypothetical protein
MPNARSVFTVFLALTYAASGSGQSCPSSTSLKPFSGPPSPKGWQYGAAVTLYIISNSTSGVFSTGTNSEVDAIESAFQRWTDSLNAGLIITPSIVDTAPTSPTSPYVTVQFGDTSVLCSGRDACTHTIWDATSAYVLNATMIVKASYTTPKYELFAHEFGHTFAIDDCLAGDCNNNVTLMSGPLTANTRISPSCCDKKLMYSMSSNTYGSSSCGPAFKQGTAYLDLTWDHTTVSATFPHNPEPGNTIIVGCLDIDVGGTPGTVTDNQGTGVNTYNKIVSEAGHTNYAPVAIFVADHVQSNAPYGSSSGTFAVSCSVGGSADAINLFAVEYSDLAPTNGVADATTSTNSAGNLSSACSTTLTTNAANDLVVGLYNNFTGNNPAGVTTSSGHTFPACTGGDGGVCAAQNGSVYEVSAMATGVASTAGSNTIGFTGPSSQWSCAAAALKPIGP